MKDLYFDSEDHQYYWKGEKKDCVSDVLKMIDVISMRGIPQRNIEIASERGTKVHQLTEDFDYGQVDIFDEDFTEENGDVYSYVLAYADWANKHNSFPIASEESIYSEELDIAGTIDLIKEIDGELTIIDKKTSKTISELRSSLQLNLYRLMWNETHERKVDKLLILQLCENATYKDIPIPVNEQKALEWKQKYDEIKGDRKL